jgi:hypothetical protein
VFVAVNNPNWQHAPQDGLGEVFRRHWEKGIELTKREGYFPPEASTFQVTIPAGCGLEWGRSIMQDDKRYFAGNPDISSFYTSWQPRNEIISLVFSDDILIFRQVEPKSIDGWCETLTSARVTRVLVHPQDYGANEIGHVGMFKDEEGRIWDIMRDSLIKGEIPSPSSVRRWNQGKSKL